MQGQYVTTRKIAGIIYQIRELTTGDIRQWLHDIEQAAAKAESPQVLRWWHRIWRKFLHFIGAMPKPLPAANRDAVDLMLFEGFVMFDLRYLTNLTESQIATLTPRQIREVWAECEEVNKDFFLLRGRLETEGMASRMMSAEILNALSRS